MDSMLTSHLRATYDAAVKCVERDLQLTSAYAENQDVKSERHDSVESCPLAGNFVVERDIIASLVL